MNSSIFQSELHDERTFYPAFHKDLNTAQEEVIIESRYLTVHRALEFYPVFSKLVRRGVKVYVITKILEDLERPFALQSDKVISRLEEVGVQPLLCKGNHHRKLAIIDRQILWEGSLNILSQAQSREIMRRIDDTLITSNTCEFLQLNRLIK